MAKTKIEWVATPRPDGTLAPGYTHNPWIGCTKVSPGCQHCYAEAWANRYSGWASTWGPQGTRKLTSVANRRKPLGWNRKAEREGVRRKVFCGSLCDVFEDRDELIPYRYDLFQLIADTPQLDWLLLTKRPENVNRMAANYAGDCAWLGWSGAIPRSNIWIGTSIENQEQADIRIPHLRDVWDENVTKFLSVEPLLGPIDLWLAGAIESDGAGGEGGGQLINFDRGLVDQVIVGGESGPSCRPMNLDWARDIRDQCKAADVPFFFKQTGGHPNKGGALKDIPEDLRIRQFPRE